MFKLSKYNILIENLEDSYLIYNTRSGAFCSIEKKYKKDIDILLENPSNTQNIFFKEFFNAGIIVKKDLDEVNDVYNLFKYYTNNKDNKKFFITIVPYEGCNFDCPYCFVYRKRNVKMKLNNYRYILNFIKKNITEKTSFNLCFFGGEPTLQKNQILNFMKNLNSLISICTSKNISMITNGYLLTKENFIDYLSSGINEYQITLDGYKNVHDETRYLKNKKGTFNRIWDNLINIKNIEKDVSFKIVIRCNFLKTNIESYYELLDQFLRNFRDDYRFGIYFKPVYEFSQSDNKIESIKKDICDLYEGLDIQLKLNSSYFLKTYSLENEYNYFNPPLPFPVPFWCTTDIKNFFIFGPENKVYKCDSYFGENEKSVGELLENGLIKFNDNILKWQKNFENEKCFQCKMLPICQGGCMRIKVEKGDHYCYWNEEIIKDLMIKHHKISHK